MTNSSEYNKAYYALNKAKIAAQKAVPTRCEHCNETHPLSYIPIHKKTKSHKQNVKIAELDEKLKNAELEAKVNQMKQSN